MTPSQIRIIHKTKGEAHNFETFACFSEVSRCEGMFIAVDILHTVVTVPRVCFSCSFHLFIYFFFFEAVVRLIGLRIT